MSFNVLLDFQIFVINHELSLKLATTKKLLAERRWVKSTLDVIKFFSEL